MGIINEYEEILIGNRKKISSNYFLFDKREMKESRYLLSDTP